MTENTSQKDSLLGKFDTLTGYISHDPFKGVKMTRLRLSVICTPGCIRLIDCKKTCQVDTLYINLQCKYDVG